MQVENLSWDNNTSTILQLVLLVWPIREYDGKKINCTIYIVSAFACWKFDNQC